MGIRPHLLWGAAVAGILAAGVFACIKWLPPRERAAVVLVQKPWMALDLAKEQGSPVPFADRDNLDILYLISVHGDGRAVKIDLGARTLTPIRFRDEGQEQTRIAQYDLGGPHLFNVTPLQWLFRGEIENRQVYHLFGSPWPNAPMTRSAQLRHGEWRLRDVRDGVPVELLRIQVRDSERRETGFGDLYVSLDSRWIVFVDPDFSSRIFIFSRDPANGAAAAS